MPHKRDELSKRKAKAPPPPQKASKPVKARAIGLIGAEAYAKLEAAGLTIIIKEDDHAPMH